MAIITRVTILCMARIALGFDFFVFHTVSRQPPPRLSGAGLISLKCPYYCHQVPFLRGTVAMKVDFCFALATRVTECPNSARESEISSKIVE